MIKIQLALYSSITKALLTMSLTVFILASCTSNPVKDTPLRTEPINNHDIINDAPLSVLHKKALNDAIELINNDDFESAKKSLKVLHDQYPVNNDIAAHYALSAYKTNNRKLANTLLAKNAYSPLAQNLLGIIALEDQRPSDADIYFKKAIELDKKYAQPYYNLAFIYDTYYQDLKGAIELYQTYLLLIDFIDEDTQKWIKSLEQSAARED